MACYYKWFAAIIIAFCWTYAVVLPNDLSDGVYEFTWLPGTKGQIAGWTWFDVPHDVNVTALQWKGYFPMPARKHDISCLPEDMRMENITVSTFTNRNDTRKAMEMLGNWCEMNWVVHKDAMVVAVVNDQLWYVCNWDNMHNTQSNQQRCSKLEIYWADAMIDSNCTEPYRGQLSIGLWQKTYGRSHRFGDICEGKDTWSH